jgi:hypothetical protein
VNEATCKTCPFFVPFRSAEADPRLGSCRRSPPQPMMTASAGDDPELGSETPEVSSAWWCGEHPLRQRDRLAAMAMQGLNAAGWAQDTSTRDIADIAYSQADAMLAARKGTP